jgi:hypothetical protein
MTKADKAFEEIFNLPETPKVDIVVKPPEPEDLSDDEKMELDFNTTRENLNEIIAKGMDALQDALAIAKSSEHPRAFEVSAGIMKTVNDISKDLMNLHKAKKEIKYGKIGANSNDPNTPLIGNQQNNFYSTTSDLLKQIRKEEDKSFVDIEPNKD